MAGSEVAVPKPSAELAFAELLAPIGGQLTLGSTLGFTAGVALRFVGRMAAVGVGMTFCVVQGLAYQGYLQVDWRALERDYLNILDRDADGQVGGRDLALVWKQAEDVLAFNLPAGMGFTAGLAYGLGGSFGTSWKAALAAGLGGRLLATRVAVGGLGAFSSPAAVVGLQTFTGTGPKREETRPGYCQQHFLGEAEANCVWSRSLLAAQRKK
eukprot:TRINITY_DN112602_c0_g1_i1.p1 TRINITY_DN112602_c0_g1~~TRINITY_DN112602_c0_g1_i1.p1  ORF type:complete len:228 (+),score=63.43 TRINITY_DN112602_c0_g1_i1:51-686(+)